MSTGKQAPSIFINYRRKESRDKAIILRILLELHFGEKSVFMDETSVTLGKKWANSLKKGVEKAEVMLSLIHKDWHKDQLESGFPRLHEKDDWVRNEIALAKKLGIPLIPVLIDGAVMPKDEWLPAPIQGLFDDQGIQLNFKDLSGKELKKLLHDLNTYVTRWKKDQKDASPEEFSSEPIYYQEAIQQRFKLPEELQEQIPDIDSPYVGLKPFSRQEARIFYGRSREIYNLCYKIIYQEQPNILLLDGYSGTGKSSLLQAGIIPRIEEKEWAVAYGRREEDQLEGLGGVFKRLMKELSKSSATRKLLILDQVEEAINNPINIKPDELEELIHLLSKKSILNPSMKFILGFRSEHTARIKKLLSDDALRYDGENTLFPLDRNGLLEAINSICRDKELRSKIYPLFFKPASVPEKIADQLLAGRLGYYVAPLLQVNMKLLWEKCKQPDGTIDITSDDVENIIDSYEKLLNYYITKVHQRIPTGLTGDLPILEVLHLFVAQKPASATLPKELIPGKLETLNESSMKNLMGVLNELYLLTSREQGTQKVTRLTHDVLAVEIQKRYDRLKSRRLDESLNQSFDLLLQELEKQLDQLEYPEANESLKKLLDTGIRREELRPYLLELLFFWNECEREELLQEVISFWLNSNLLQEAAYSQLEALSNKPDKDKIQNWLSRLDQNKYADLEKLYLAPEDTCMVKVEGGALQREKGGKVTLDTFRMANVQTTFRKYGLYLYAIGAEDRLKEMSPNWGMHASHPVVYVNWYNAVEYCNWLSETQELEKVYEIDKNKKDPKNLNKDDDIKWLVIFKVKANGYRLPTEAEWEFAARGGNRSQRFEYAGSNHLDEVGWYDKNSDGQTNPVAQKKANELGLYDMSGNVWEWCWDWYGPYSEKQQENPVGPNEGEFRVVRGGSWNVIDDVCRVSFRVRYLTHLWNDGFGFRVARC